MGGEEWDIITMHSEKEILDAYQFAAREEIRLQKLEEKKRKLDAEIGATRARRRDYMDKLHQMHLGLSAPVAPFADTPELVTKLSTI
jgi:hypothetical protein